MSEVQFGKLAIRNFLSISEGELNLADRGLTLISGINEDDPSASSNGAGKSATVDALYWAIYGQTARGKSGDGVVNRFVGKDCSVEVEVKVGSDVYDITRYRKHSKGKNRLTLFKNGGDITQGTDKLTQELVEKIVGCDVTVFTASIYAGQNAMPNLPSMTDKDLKNVVEQAAGIGLLDSAYGIARERERNATSAHLTASKNLELLDKDLAERREALEKFVDDEKRREVIRQEEIKVLITERQERENALTLCMDQIVKIDEEALIALEAGIHSKLIKMPELVLPEIPSAIAPIPAPVKPTEDKEIARLKTQIEIGKSKLKDIVADISNLEEELLGVDDEVGKPCAACGQELGPEHLETSREHIRSKIALLEVSKSSVVKDVKSLIGKYTTAQAAQRDLEATYAKALEEHETSVAASYTANIDALKKYNDECNAAREKHASVEAERKKWAVMLEEIRIKKDHLADVKGRALLIRSEIARLGDRVTSLRAPTGMEKLIEGFEAKIKERESEIVAAEKTLEERYEALTASTHVTELFSPKGMRGEILDSVTPFLNVRTAEYLSALSDGAISAEWKTIGETAKGEAREKFHIDVTNVNGDDEFMGLSGGEQRKVRIATAMALQDLVATRAERPIKLFIADEVDDALDDNGLERLMTVMDAKARAVGSVLVISHNSLSDWIPNEITVIKKGGLSTLIEL